MKNTDRERLMMALGILEEHGLGSEAAALYPEDDPRVPVYGDPDWNEIDEENRLNRQRREAVADGEELPYCEGCERSGRPLVTGRIMPGATVPVEWCRECIDAMPTGERATWGLPRILIVRNKTGHYFVRSNGMGGAVWTANPAEAMEFNSLAAAHVIDQSNMSDAWSVEEVAR